MHLIEFYMHFFSLTTKPLRIEEVKITESGVFVVEQETIFVQKFGRLIELGPVAEFQLVLGPQLARYGRLELLLIQDRIASL